MAARLNRRFWDDPHLTKGAGKARTHTLFLFLFLFNSLSCFFTHAHMCNGYIHQMHAHIHTHTHTHTHTAAAVAAAAAATVNPIPITRKNWFRVGNLQKAPFLEAVWHPAPSRTSQAARSLAITAMFFFLNRLLKTTKNGSVSNKQEQRKKAKREENPKSKGEQRQCVQNVAVAFAMWALYSLTRLDAVHISHLVK